MPSTVRIPLIMRVKEPVDFQIRRPRRIRAFAGHSITFKIRYNPGAPPITVGQLSGAYIDLYTDEARTDKLSETEEVSGYVEEIQPIEGKNAFKLTLGLAAVNPTENRTLYGRLMIEQGKPPKQRKCPFILDVRLLRPRVRLSRLKDNTVWIRFTERVYGFEETDIKIKGGTFSNFRGNQKDFLVEVKVTTDESQARLWVPRGVATNAEGRENKKSNVLVVT